MQHTLQASFHTNEHIMKLGDARQISFQVKVLMKQTFLQIVALLWHCVIQFKVQMHHDHCSGVYLLLQSSEVHTML